MIALGFSQLKLRIEKIQSSICQLPLALANGKNPGNFISKYPAVYTFSLQSQSWNHYSYLQRWQKYIHLRNL